MGLGGAVKMEPLLLLMKRPTDDARTRGSLGLSPPEIADWHARFLTLLDEGDRVHPRILTPKGKRGRAKQHPGRNLLDRLRKHQDSVLAFLSDLAVPFDNNLAEMDLRMSHPRTKKCPARPAPPRDPSPLRALLPISP